MVTLNPQLISKQNRYLEALPGVYDILNTDAEVSTSVQQIGPLVGLTPSQMNAFARDLESVGILARRLEFKRGRHYYWRLTKPLDEAQSIYATHLEQERANSGWVGHKVSGKTLIMNALAEHGQFATIRDLVKSIGTEAQSKKGYHSITHELRMLEKQGKVEFKTTTSRAKVPFDIRLKGKSVPEPVTRAEDINPFIEVKPEPVVETVIESRPLIANLVARRERLETAARLAEAAGADDLAITLYDRAADLTPFEEEVVSLYSAHENCNA